MGFSDFLKELAGEVARSLKISADRIERNHGDRLNEEQLEKLDRMRSSADTLSFWANHKDDNCEGDK